jgi:hypothetical protein
MLVNNIRRALLGLTKGSTGCYIQRHSFFNGISHQLVKNEASMTSNKASLSFRPAGATVPSRLADGYATLDTKRPEWARHFEN